MATGLMLFCLLDVSNLVHRAKHVVKQYDSVEECVSTVLTTVFLSIRKAYDKFGATHCVCCFDTNSWRYEVYPEYKASRKLKDDSDPQTEERNQIIKQVLVDLKKFLKDCTNVTVLDAKMIEADDFIARWIDLHNDEGFKHIIISADGDFRQLVQTNVDLYDPIRNMLYRLDGIYVQDGKRIGRDTPKATFYGDTWKIVMDKDGVTPKKFDPEWELFFKCIRGDSSDNIKSAYPKVRTEAMKKAFDKRGQKEWNNFINDTVKVGDTTIDVRKRYDFNRQLIDLRAQPDHIITTMDMTIGEAINQKHKKLVGAYFAKFCQRYRLDLMNKSGPITYLLSQAY